MSLSVLKLVTYAIKFKDAVCSASLLVLRQRADRHHFICIVTHKVTYSVLKWNLCPNMSIKILLNSMYIVYICVRTFASHMLTILYHKYFIAHEEEVQFIHVQGIL